jgi:hypothetical protein
MADKPTTDAEPSESTGYFGPVPPNSENDPIPAAKSEEMDDGAAAFQKRIGVTFDMLKGKLDKPDLQFDDKTKQLVNQVRDIIQGGMAFSLKDWRIYAAIDEAYNVSYQQINPTLIRKIIGKSFKNWQDIVKEFEQWGLNAESLYSTVKGEDGVDKKVLKEKTFWKIFIPLVKSYLTIRLAKLYNDRDQYPFLKYEPNKFTDEAWMVGEILTELVERMVQNYGYRAIFRQQLHQMLKYSFSFMFPAEAWHKETAPDDEGDGQHATKEGLRYNIPHPTKVAWDLNYRPATFNTDTGCEWAFYWRVYKYKDIYGNPYFWRKEIISASTNNWLNAYPQYFSEVFPCRMEPFTTSNRTETSREEASAFYSRTSDSEKAVFLSDLFIKLTPSQYGWGEYAHPVWFRFVVANEDCIVYAEPLAYCPVLYVGYDEDQNQPRNPGMALEIMPWQDATGNLLSQWILSMKQNLKKIVAYDKKAVTAEAIDELTATANDSEKTTWMGVEKRQLTMQGADFNQIFFPVSFPMNDIGQFVITMDKMFTIMERTLNMSAAETGAAGVHIQTAEEIRVISNNVSNRVGYTGASVDDFADAWKRQLATATRTYADREFVVEVSKTSEDSAKVLKNLGFELVDENGKSVKVKGPQAKVVMNAYISSREFQQRLNDPQIGNLLLQNLAALSKTPVGMRLAAEQPEFFSQTFNRINRLLGGPRDWKVPVNFKPMPAEQPAQGGQPGEGQGGQPQGNPMEALLGQINQMIQQQIGQAGQAIVQTVMQQVTEGMQPVVQAIQEAKQESANIQQVNDQQQQAIESMGQLLLKIDAVIKAANSAPVPPPAMPPQPGPMPPPGMMGA